MSEIINECCACGATYDDPPVKCLKCGGPIQATLLKKPGDAAKAAAALLADRKPAGAPAAKRCVRITRRPAKQANATCKPRDDMFAAAQALVDAQRSRLRLVDELQEALTAAARAWDRVKKLTAQLDGSMPVSESPSPRSGDPKPAGAKPKRPQRILDELRNGPGTASGLAARMGLKCNNIADALRKMAREGTIKYDSASREYRLPLNVE